MNIFKKYKNIITRMGAFALALLLFTGSFSYSGLNAKADGVAKYTNPKFAFDFSAIVSDELRTKISQCEYIYIFHFKKGLQYDWGSFVPDTLYRKQRINFYSDQEYGCKYVEGEGYYVLISGMPLVGNCQYGFSHPFVTLSTATSDRHTSYGFYCEGSNCSVSAPWKIFSSGAYGYTTSMRYTTNYADIFNLYRYTYFNPTDVEIMTNTDICQYNNSNEVLWKQNLSDDVLTTFKNVNTSGSGSTGGSSPTIKEPIETGELVEIDESNTLKSIFTNISVIARHIVNLPYYIAHYTAQALGLDALFDKVIEAINNLGNLWLELPRSIADKILENSFFTDVINHFVNLPMNIGKVLANNQLFADMLDNLKSMATNFVNLPLNIGKALANNEIFTGMLNHLKTLVDKYTELPLEIGENIASGEWFDSMLDNITKIPDLIIEGIESIFIPEDGYIEDKIEYIKSDFRELGVEAYNMGSLFNKEQAFEDIEAEIHGTKATFVNMGLVCETLAHFRPLIRGFLWLMLAYYNINQFLGLIGQPSLATALGVVKSANS